MPTAPVRFFNAWSYSRLSDYEFCAFRAMLKHLQKIAEPANEAMARGSAIHKKADKYTMGKIKRLPKELSCFTEEFKALRKRKGVLTENQMAVNSAFGIADWFGKGAWLRAVVDAVYLDGDRLVVIDHKTGKIRPTHQEQMEIFALVGFAYNPKVKEIETQLWYLDQGEDDSKLFKRADIKPLQKKWKKRTKKMLSDRKFAPEPGYKCKWCPHRKSEGGRCRF